jgi:hypothetical protein
MIGMTIGALVVIIPDRQQEVTKLAFRALIAGTVASYLTACVAGNILYNENLHLKFFFYSFIFWKSIFKFLRQIDRSVRKEKEVSE